MKLSEAKANESKVFMFFRDEKKTPYRQNPYFVGFVLKKDQKKEEKTEEISLEELIEKEVSTAFPRISIDLYDVSKEYYRPKHN